MPKKKREREQAPQRVAKREEETTDNIPILINHIRNPKPLIYNLTPSIPVKILTAQLTTTQIPRRAIRERAIPENLRDLLPLPQTLLQPKQMPIDTLPIARITDIPDMRIHRGPEPLRTLLSRDLRVGHRIAESDALVGHGAAGFGTALLEAAGGGGFVGRTVHAVHLVVGELDDHLDVGIGRALEFLDETLAIPLVGLDFELVLADEVFEVAGRALDIGFDVVVDDKF